MDFARTDGEVELGDVSRVFHVGGSEVHALNHVDLSIPRGQFLGVVGVSGSGKSTLLHVMGGLDTPTSGQVRVAGQTLGDLNRYQRSIFRRQVVGFIFQAFYLVGHQTAEANVRLALTVQGVYGAERRRLASEALDRVGLRKRAAHRPGQLSGGEQQRVAIARAIVHRPQLLLADEPTGNLDRHSAEDLAGLLRRINEESGTTIIMVTHNEKLASDYCHRTIAMSDGQLVSQEAGL